VRAAPDVTAVILAAGESTRMGAEKLTMPVRGIPMIERVIAACENLPALIVASPQLLPFLNAGESVEIIVNDDPALGMAHSLALAHRWVAPGRALLVLLADKPLVHAGLLAAVLERAGAERADVCFPVRGGLGGHPVFFGTAARAKIPALPDGDSLQVLRDDPTLRRITLESRDEGAYVDVDDPGALRRLSE